MTEGSSHELLVLPPIADDPIFTEELFSETPDLDTLAAASVGLSSSQPGRDPRDFASLFIRHRWSFALHARRFLHDERDVDEVVQEGFLRLFLAMPELETELQALAYCRRTVTNLCIDRYRADQRRPRLLDLETLPDDVFLEDDDIDPIVQAEDAAIVRQALAMLSPLHREALIKREVQEKSLPQIAAELEISVEQTKHLLHRARRSLRRLLVGTHVEPGVDLDLAMVLAANKVRAARAAKPTGAAALAVLLVLAGVLGLRSGSGSRRVVEVAPAGAGLGSIVGDPLQPHQTLPQPPTPTAAATHGTAAPGHSTVLPPRTPVTPPSAAPQAGPVPGPPVPGHVHTGPSVPAVPVVTAASYVVSGVGGSGSAQVSDQQRSVQGAAMTSSSTISTRTAAGTYALRQAFSFAPDGSLTDVSLNEAVPVGSGGAVGTLVTATSSSVETLGDGSVHLLTNGTAAPISSVNGTAVVPRALTVDVVLAPDRVRVLSEHVDVVDLGLASPVRGTPGGAPVDPTPAPSDPAPATPPAPQSSARQDPALLPGAPDPATPTASVVVQDPVNR